MKSNELLIGDYCQDKNGNVFEVDGTSAGMLTLKDEHNQLHNVLIEDVVSIFLNSGILVNNGFSLNKNMGSYNGWTYFELVKKDSLNKILYEVICSYSRETQIHVDVRKHDNDFGNDNVFCGQISYVHEFQHALNLCGIDIRINPN